MIEINTSVIPGTVLHYHLASFPGPANIRPGNEANYYVCLIPLWVVAKQH